MWTGVPAALVTTMSVRDRHCQGPTRRMIAGIQRGGAGAGAEAVPGQGATTTVAAGDIQMGDQLIVIWITPSSQTQTLLP
jgi:hypothetical protein